MSLTQKVDFTKEIIKIAGLYKPDYVKSSPDEKKEYQYIYAHFRGRPRKLFFEITNNDNFCKNILSLFTSDILYTELYENKNIMSEAKYFCTRFHDIGGVFTGEGELIAFFSISDVKEKYLLLFDKKYEIVSNFDDVKEKYIEFFRASLEKNLDSVNSIIAKFSSYLGEENWSYLDKASEYINRIVIS